MLLVHDVGERRHRPALSRADTLVLKSGVLFIVECGKSLVAVNRRFVRFRYLPDHHGNRAAIAFLNREIGASLATLKNSSQPFKFAFPRIVACGSASASAGR